MTEINKKTLKVKLHYSVTNYFLNFREYFSMISVEQLIKHFLSTNYNYIITNNDDADMVLYTHTVGSLRPIDKNKIHIFISIENILNKNHFRYYNEYGNYGDEMIDIYLYNHIGTIYKTDKFLAIPQIHLTLNYYIQYHHTISPTIITNYNDKDRPEKYKRSYKLE